MIDAVYFYRIAEELKKRKKEEVITFGEARRKWGIPSMYKTIQSAPGYNHILDVIKTEDEVVYKLKEDWKINEELRKQ